MIFFWLREIAGWLLILVSLYLLRVGLVFLNDLNHPGLVESGIVMLTGLGVMRCGILLVRVSTAARLCREESKASSQ